MQKKKKKLQLQFNASKNSNLFTRSVSSRTKAGTEGPSETCGAALLTCSPLPLPPPRLTTAVLRRQPSHSSCAVSSSFHTYCANESPWRALRPRRCCRSCFHRGDNDEEQELLIHTFPSGAHAHAVKTEVDSVLLREVFTGCPLSLWWLCFCSITREDKRFWDDPSIAKMILK